MAGSCKHRAIYGRQSLEHLPARLLTHPPAQGGSRSPAVWPEATHGARGRGPQWKEHPQGDPKPPCPPASQGERPCNQPLAGSRAGKLAGSSRERNAEANAGRSQPNCMQISQTQMKNHSFSLVHLQFVLPAWTHAPAHLILAAPLKKAHLMPKPSCPAGSWPKWVGALPPAQRNGPEALAEAAEME